MEARPVTTDRERYESPRRDGRPCQGLALPGRQYCFNHDPALVERRLQGQRKGGAHSAKIIRLRSLVPPRLVPIFDTLESALGEVHSGDLDPKQATAMASLARAMVAVLQAGELEERVRRLEHGQEGGQDATGWPS